MAENIPNGDTNGAVVNGNEKRVREHEGRNLKPDDFETELSYLQDRMMVIINYFCFICCFCCSFSKIITNYSNICTLNFPIELIIFSNSKKK